MKCLQNEEEIAKRDRSSCKRNNSKIIVFSTGFVGNLWARQEIFLAIYDLWEPDKEEREARKIFAFVIPGYSQRTRP
jgi:hypothetical protein